MVKYCSAYDCYSYCGTSGLSFHRIPKDVVRRKQWVSALKLKRQLRFHSSYSSHRLSSILPLFLSKNTAHSRKLPEHAPCPITFPVLKQPVRVPVRVLNPLTVCSGPLHLLLGLLRACCYTPAGRGLLHKLLFRPKLAWENGNAIRK